MFAVSFTTIKMVSNLLPYITVIVNKLLTNNLILNNIFVFVFLSINSVPFTYYSQLPPFSTIIIIWPSYFILQKWAPIVC